MEGQTVIEALVAKVYEIFNCKGSFVAVKLNLNGSVVPDNHFNMMCAFESPFSSAGGEAKKYKSQ